MLACVKPQFALAILATALLIQPQQALAQPVQAAAAPMPPSGPVANLSALSQDAFLRLLVARNLDVEFSKISVNINRHLRDGEAALYEPVFFMSLRKEGRNRQRSYDETSQTSPLTPLLNENVITDEFGVRSKLPTGADLSVSYRKSGRQNNLIAQSYGSTTNAERSDLLSLTLKQPLLKNAGRSVTETDRQLADLEYQIALQQLTQQALKISIEGLNLYWQLYKAQETLKLRKTATATTEALMKDTQDRITAGKTPASAVLELQSALLNREAEWLRSQQTLSEAQSKIATTVNLLWGSTQTLDTLGTAPRLVSDTAHTAPATAPALKELLVQWTPYQIALLRQQQAQARQSLAQNQTLPTVDLVMNYSGTGLSRNVTDARILAGKFTYPDWYVGVNVEIPLDGNQKAKAQLAAQNARLHQSQLELEAIENAFANDMLLRLADLKNAITTLDLSKREVKLRDKIFQNERERVQIGSGSLGNLLQKQADSIEAGQKLLENQVRYEIALAMWQYTRGSLLADNGISVFDVHAP